MELEKTGSTKQLTVSDYSSLERKKWVMDQYLSGEYPVVIRENYMHLFKLTSHSFDKDVLWMNNELRRKGENDLEAIIERHTDRYNFLYKIAVEKGDIRSAAVALKQLEDLYKLHKPSTGSMNVQINNVTASNLTMDELYTKLNRDKPNTIISIDPVENDDNE